MPKTPKATRSDAIAELKSRVRATTALVIEDDRLQQRLLAVWHLVTITEKHTFPDRFVEESLHELSIDSLRATVWSGIEIGISGVCDLLGKDFPSLAVVDRSRNLLMIYPDGTIHEKAEEILNRRCRNYGDPPSRTIEGGTVEG